MYMTAACRPHAMANCGTHFRVNVPHTKPANVYHIPADRQRKQQGQNQNPGNVHAPWITPTKSPSKQGHADAAHQGDDAGNTKTFQLQTTTSQGNGNNTLFHFILCAAKHTLSSTQPRHVAFSRRLATGVWPRATFKMPTTLWLH